MQVLEHVLASDFEELNTAVALGTFDGMHLGHRHIMDLLKKNADGLSTIVYTFSNLPVNVYGNAHLSCLFTASEKIRVFEDLGLDYLILEDFTKEIAGMPAEKFMDVLINVLHAKFIVVGFNYSFGKNGEGNPRLLKEYAAGRGCSVLVSEPVLFEGEPVSSSRIRAALAQGEIKKATLMLGNPYGITARVEQGRRIGRTLGFPTANFLFPSNKLIPKSGVYVTEIHYEGEKYIGITNIGTRPTIDSTSDEYVIETHIMGFSKKIYGETLRVDFLEYIREEKKYDTVEGLKRQLKNDQKFAMEFYQKNK